MSAPRSLRVLILEDQPTDAALVLDELRQFGFEPEWRRVETQADYRADLHENLDIILADYSLPQFNALQALHGLQQSGLDIPFIIVTGTISEEVAVECMKQGAADYLLKDRLARLGSAVVKALEDRRLRMEKQQAEAALRASEEKHRLLFDHAGLGIGYYTPQGQAVAFNRLAAANMGGEPGDYTGKTLSDLYGEEAGAVYLERIKVAAWSQDGRMYEDFVPLPTGDRWFLSTFARITDDSGAVIGVQVISNDITERKRAEEALHESERFARSTLDGLSAHIAILDEAGTILAVNRSWRSFAEENPPVAANVSEGANYLAVCDQASGAWSDGATEFAAGIRTVLSGKLDRFEAEYPCHSPDEQRWFLGRVTRFPGEGPVRVVVAHENTTQLKWSELKLAEERNLLRTMIDNLPDFIYAKDIEGRFLVGNIALARSMGVTTPEELSGKTDTDYYPAASFAQYNAEEQAIIRSGKPLFNRETLLLDRAANSVGWLLTTKVPLRDPEGNVIGLVGISHDITERKRMTDAERDQRVLAEALRDTAAALTSTLDPGIVMARILENVGRVMPHDYASIMIIEGEVARPAYCQGWRPDEETAYKALRFPLETRNLSEMLITGKPTVIPDTAEYSGWLHVTPHERSYIGAPIRSHDHVIGFLDLLSAEPDFFTAVHADRLGAFADQAATAIENAQLYDELRQYSSELELRVIERTAQLSHVKERIEAILNSSSDMMILCRTDSTIDQVNPAFDESFGYTSDEVYNRPLTILAVPEHVSLLEQKFKIVMQTRQPQRLEITVRCKTSATFDGEMMLSPVAGLDSQLLGVVCSLRDITERKKMEAHLRQMLEHEVELSELKSRYVSMAAHDLRNPLAAILMTVEVIQNYSQRLTEEQKLAKFNGIRHSIKTMVELLNDTLTIGQAGSGKLKFEPGSLDLITFSQDLVTELQEATGSTQRINFSYQGVCDTVYMDAKLLRHILGNLLSNALKYSPAGSSVSFDIQCASNTVTFRILDQGIGIPQADQERLFETFHRAGNVGSTPGTGLGLAIVKQSVDLHGGTITFESEEGVGTTFTVILPQMPIRTEGYQ